MENTPDTKLSEQPHTRLQALHIAASFNQFETIYHLTTEDLAQKGGGDRIITAAARHGHLYDIEHLITPELLKMDRGEPLYQIVKNGHAEMLPDVISDELLCLTPYDTENLYHVACRSGTIKTIAKHLTEKGIQAKNSFGDTPLHIAAEHGTLEHIPETFMQDKYLSIRNSTGESTYHIAATNGTLNQIPESLVLANLESRNALKSSVIFLASHTTRVDQLLGMRLPPTAKSLVSEEWWNKNLELVKLRDNLIQDHIEPNEIDIF